MVMFERLNLESLKGSFDTLKGKGLETLKGVDLAQVKGMGDTALKSLSKLSKKRLSVGGYSINPLLLGGAAAVALGGYLLYRSRSNGTALAGNTTMQGQVHPVKLLIQRLQH
jgi:hypothetical protein